MHGKGSLDHLPYDSGSRGCSNGSDSWEDWVVASEVGGTGGVGQVVVQAVQVVVEAVAEGVGGSSADQRSAGQELGVSLGLGLGVTLGQPVVDQSADGASLGGGALVGVVDADRRDGGDHGLGHGSGGGDEGRGGVGVDHGAGS